jgi:phosphoglycolate phosphatase
LPSNLKPRKFDLIFLDFDGVVVQSNDIKDRAFEKIFAQVPEHYDELIAYHLAHNVIPRREKFRHAVYEVLRSPEGDALVDRWVNQFEELTREAVIACPFVNGAELFLSRASQTLPLVLVSATPQTDLDLIVDRRRLRAYFTEVHGAGKSKSQIMSKVLDGRGFTADRALFLGDSPEDLTAAREAGVAFLGIHGRTNFSGDASVESVADLAAALNWFSERQSV